MIATGMETLPSYRELAELLKDGLTPEAQEKILELRHMVMALQEANFTLRERIKQLEAVAAPTHNNVLFDKGVYWTVEAGTRQGPFCPACHDRTSKLVRLHYSHTGVPGVYWICKSCQQNW